MTNLIDVKLLKNLTFFVKYADQLTQSLNIFIEELISERDSFIDRVNTMKKCLEELETECRGRKEHKDAFVNSNSSTLEIIKKETSSSTCSSPKINYNNIVASYGDKNSSENSASEILEQNIVCSQDLREIQEISDLELCTQFDETSDVNYDASKLKRMPKHPITSTAILEKMFGKISSIRSVEPSSSSSAAYIKDGSNSNGGVNDDENDENPIISKTLPVDLFVTPKKNISQRTGCSSLKRILFESPLSSTAAAAERKNDSETTCWFLSPARSHEGTIKNITPKKRKKISSPNGMERGQLKKSNRIEAEISHFGVRKLTQTQLNITSFRANSATALNATDVSDKEKIGETVERGPPREIKIIENSPDLDATRLSATALDALTVTNDDDEFTDKRAESVFGHHDEKEEFRRRLPAKDWENCREYIETLANGDSKVVENLLSKCTKQRTKRLLIQEYTPTNCWQPYIPDTQS